MTNFEALFKSEFFIRAIAEKRVWRSSYGWSGDFEQESQHLHKEEAIDKEVKWLKKEYDGVDILDQRLIDEFNRMENC